MTHFLWVEDFNDSEDKRPDNIFSSTVKSVFGSLLDEKELREKLEEDVDDARDFLKEKGILLKLSLLEALEFIHNPDELSKIDFVVLDVDMPLSRNGENDDNECLLRLIEQYQSADDLRKIAGYQIYTELVIELGFPKAHILFCSNHASYFDQLKGKFASANIKPPLSSNPDKPFLTKDDTTDIKQWLNDAHNNYFVLRRGIIEGCRHISTNMSEDKLRFNDFINEPEKKVSFDDILDYVKVLENFLPLREPGDTHKAVLYKLFIRTLSHEWEATEPKQLNKQNKQNGLYAFTWIMKMSRNWLAHGKVFEQLIAPDLAYLFIVNMRAMFDLGDQLLPYEKHLLGLFSKVISINEMKEVIGSYHGNRKIPLIQSYAALLHTSGKHWEAVSYHDALNQFQKSKNEKSLEDIAFLITGLYQSFWFLTSNGFVSLPTDADKKLDLDKLDGYKALNYQFGFFDYRKPNFLLEFSRHIYSRSFAQEKS